MSSSPIGENSLLWDIVEINSYALRSQCRIDRRFAPPDAVLAVAVVVVEFTSGDSVVQPLLWRLLLRLRFSEEPFGTPYMFVGDGERRRLRPRRPRDGLELFARFLELTVAVLRMFVTGCSSGETSRDRRIISYGSESADNMEGRCFILYVEGSRTVPALPRAAWMMGVLEWMRTVPPIGVNGRRVPRHFLQMVAFLVSFFVPLRYSEHEHRTTAISRMGEKNCPDGEATPGG